MEEIQRIAVLVFFEKKLSLGFTFTKFELIQFQDLKILNLKQRNARMCERNQLKYCVFSMLKNLSGTFQTLYI